MNIVLPLLIPILAATPTTRPECEYEAERTALVEASDARLVRVAAEAGSLVVEGRPGLTEVRVRGRACASDQELLEEVRLTAHREGDEVRIEAEVPDANGAFFRNGYARLDLVIEVPAGIAAAVVDDSGETEIRGVGAVDVEDGSGELTIEDATGPVRIDDNSGEIALARIGGDVVLTDGSGEVEAVDVRGDVTIDDGSGEIELRAVEGSITLIDNSGSIDVDEVRGSVLVRRDGSGGIRVAGVTGDFTVESDGSGGIRYRDVGGRVRVPPAN